jgi:hypothetical protein
VTFDPFSFFLGIAAVIVITAINYGIVHTVQRRKQWEQVLFNTRNPSEEFWLKSLKETPPGIADEESSLLKVSSPQPSQN